MITGDGGVQIHRGQGRVPKVLQQNAGKEAGKTWNIQCDRKGPEFRTWSGSGPKCQKWSGIGPEWGTRSGFGFGMPLL